MAGRYDPFELIERAKLFRSEASEATSSEMKEFCLREATDLDERAKRSLETPPITEPAAAVTTRTLKKARIPHLVG